MGVDITIVENVCNWNNVDFLVCVAANSTKGLRVQYLVDLSVSQFS